jgi:hypothetical protein
MGFSTSMCVPENRGCDCTIRSSGGCIESGDYEKTSPTFTVESIETYRYCATPSSLVYIPLEADEAGRRIVFVTEPVR